MKTKLDKQLLDTMSKDPGNWKGPFYYNRRDPRLMVPKLYPSLGTTFNFASPYAYITLGAIIVIAVLVKIFAF
jgi:uncharacterized membrane protein